MFDIGVRNKLIKYGKYNQIKDYLYAIEKYASSFLDDKDLASKEQKAREAANAINDICKRNNLEDFYSSSENISFKQECVNYCCKCIELVK